jgi:catechol 2,3-dioxygenase-like lactoylglutathione lyase family enzyme
MKSKINWERVSHITLPVHDLEIAEEFYVGLLGAKLIHKMDRSEFLKFRPEREDEADAENSPLHLTIAFEDIEIQLFKQPKKWTQPIEQPHPHFALHVDPDNLLPAKELLISRGIPVDGPIRLGPPTHASIYFFDPFGNHMELETMGYQHEAPLRLPNHTILPYQWKPKNG